MLKKIGITLIAFILIALGCMYYIYTNLLKPQPEAILEGIDTKTLFDTRCAVCHEGASPEAPSVPSLKLLPQEQILTAMKTGVMRNQAASLTDAQHIALAKYISEINEPAENNKVIAGLCAEDQIDESYQTASTRVDNWGIGLANQRYFPEAKSINASNAKDLKLDWVFAFPNASRARVQPTIAGNTLFTASQIGTIYALNRQTGCIQWTFQADAEIRSALIIGRDSTGRANRLFFGDFNATAYALNLDSKTLEWKVKIDDHGDATITGSMALYEDKVYIPVSSTEVLSAVDENYVCCDFRGSMVALHISDGSQAWKSYTIDEIPSAHGTNSVGNPIMAPSGAPIWTAVTIDEKRRCLYIGTGENYTRPTSMTSDAIIAMDLDDGSKRWVQQTIAKDAWNAACSMLTNRGNCPGESGPDADFGAPPILVSVDGKDLIVAGQKSGHVYALDPDDNGKILWKTLVGRGGMMGGIHWGMATNGELLYVPINDRGPYDLNPDTPKKPGLHAVNITDGKVLWSQIEEDRCPTLALRGCGPGISAAITLTPEVVFAGTLDGFMKAYAADDGRELWSYDTKRDYDPVNKVRAFGGAIDSDGPVVVDNQMFVTSGYAKFAEKEGNVLLAFSVK